MNKKKISISLAALLMLGTSIEGYSALNTPSIAYASNQMVQDVHNKVELIRGSLKKNYLGLKNVGQWQSYIKEARELNNKLPNGTSKDKYTDKINKAESLVNAAASVNQVEKSMAINSHVMKNVPQWEEYVKKAKDELAKVDKEFNNQIKDLTGRIDEITKVINKIKGYKDEDKDIVNEEDVLIRIEAPKNPWRNQVIKNGGISNRNLRLEWDNEDIASVTIQKNNESEKQYKLGTKIEDEGKYKVKTIYKSGKTTNLSFEIDKTAPVLTSKTDEVKLFRVLDSEELMYITAEYHSILQTSNDITIESESDDISKVELYDTNAKTLTPFKLGTPIKEEGAYILYVYDKAKNVAEIMFEVSKTAPIFGGIKNGDVIDLKDSPNGVEVSLSAISRRTFADCTKDNKKYQLRMVQLMDEVPDQNKTRYRFYDVGKYEFTSKNNIGTSKIEFEIVDTRE